MAVSVLVLTVPADAVPPRGASVAFEGRLGDRPLAVRLLRLPRGRFAAYLDRCPHFGIRLDGPSGTAFDGSRRHLMCSLHGALFRPEDGLCVQGPCAGDRLEALTVTELFGQLQIHLPAPLVAALEAESGTESDVSRPRQTHAAPAVRDPDAPGGSRSD